MLRRGSSGSSPLSAPRAHRKSTPLRVALLPAAFSEETLSSERDQGALNELELLFLYFKSRFEVIQVDKAPDFFDNDVLLIWKEFHRFFVSERRADLKAIMEALRRTSLSVQVSFCTLQLKKTSCAPAHGPLMGVRQLLTRLCQTPAQDHHSHFFNLIIQEEEESVTLTSSRSFTHFFKVPVI